MRFHKTNKLSPLGVASGVWDEIPTSRRVREWITPEISRPERLCRLGQWRQGERLRHKERIG